MSARNARLARLDRAGASPHAADCIFFDNVMECPNWVPVAPKQHFDLKKLHQRHLLRGGGAGPSSPAPGSHTLPEAARTPAKRRSHLILKPKRWVPLCCPRPGAHVSLATSSRCSACLRVGWRSEGCVFARNARLARCDRAGASPHAADCIFLTVHGMPKLGASCTKKAL